MKFSIVIPCFNNLQYTIQCIQAVRKHTKDYELILVDDGSTDGTGDYLRQQAKENPNTHTVFHYKNTGFPEAANSGIQVSKGDYIILLNNDVIVTPDWAESMYSTFYQAEKKLQIERVGAVGPVSNYAGGEQGIQHDQYSLNQLDKACSEHRERYQNSMQTTGFLSGFCVMLKREMLNQIGLFDPIFRQGFWEDNDLCLRAQLANWKLVIDQSTFVHHFGSATFKTLSINPNRLLQANQLRFYEKYFEAKQKSLIGIVRTHNQEDDLIKSIGRASEFCDEIIVLLDRCTDNSKNVATSCSKVSKIIEMDDGFNEARDRQALIDAAIEKGADWIYSFDSDEEIEKSFTRDQAIQLMNPVDPQVLGYGLNFKTFFLGNTHYRTDGTFGEMWGTRLWRTWKGQKIQSFGHAGLHCTHGPIIPTFNTRRLRLRVKHYGYNTEEKCKKKYNTYTKMDPEPDPVKTSPQGYSHIISTSVALNKWKEKNNITLAMIVKDEEEALLSFLSRYYTYFDDIVIVDTGSKDNTREIAHLFGARIFRHRWRQNFSEARNFAIEQCKTEWILSMDPDEEILEEDIPLLWDMIEENVDAWLFKVLNFQKNGGSIYSDNARLFRNIPEIRWSWRVHENIAPAITKHHLVCVPAPLEIRHYGFLKIGTERNRKLIQYGEMLRKQIREYPKEPLGYFHLAFHEFEEKHYQKGMELLRKAVELKPEFFLAQKEIGMRLAQEALEHILAAAKTTPQGHYYYEWLQETVEKMSKILNAPLKRG